MKKTIIDAAGNLDITADENVIRFLQRYRKLWNRKSEVDVALSFSALLLNLIEKGVIELETYNVGIPTIVVKAKDTEVIRIIKK